MPQIFVTLGDPITPMREESGDQATLGLSTPEKRRPITSRDSYIDSNVGRRSVARQGPGCVSNQILLGPDLLLTHPQDFHVRNLENTEERAQPTHEQFLAFRDEASTRFKCNATGRVELWQSPMKHFACRTVVHATPSLQHATACPFRDHEMLVMVRSFSPVMIRSSLRGLCTPRRSTISEQFGPQIDNRP